MAETRTRPTEVMVEEFLAQADPAKLADSRTLIALMEKITGEPPKMWGPSIIGFGSYHYAYASGHSGDACLTGFSPRKAEFSIYLSGNNGEADAAAREALLARLGKHRMGKGCLYVKRLDGLDMDVLEELVRRSVAGLRALYP